MAAGPVAENQRPSTPRCEAAGLARSIVVVVAPLIRVARAEKIDNDSSSLYPRVMKSQPAAPLLPAKIKPRARVALSIGANIGGFQAKLGKATREAERSLVESSSAFRTSVARGWTQRHCGG